MNVFSEQIANVNNPFKKFKKIYNNYLIIVLFSQFESILKK